MICLRDMYDSTPVVVQSNAVRMIWAGKELKEDARTLKQWSMPPECTIHVTRRQVRIYSSRVLDLDSSNVRLRRAKAHRHLDMNSPVTTMLLCVCVCVCVLVASKTLLQ
jgi:hypothetical protein